MTGSKLPIRADRQRQMPAPHDTWTPPDGSSYPDSEGVISSEYTLTMLSDCLKNQDHLTEESA